MPLPLDLDHEDPDLSVQVELAGYRSRRKNGASPSLKFALEVDRRKLRRGSWWCLATKKGGTAKVLLSWCDFGDPLHRLL